MNRELIGRYSWQYNGVALWQEVWDWCRNNFDYCWTNHYDTIHFDDEKEYAWFLLRWS